MRTTIILIFVVCFALASYALSREDMNSRHSYEWGIPTPTDSALVLFKKVDWCMTYEDRTIKWRRAFIVSFVCASMLDVIHHRIPTVKEFMLQFLIIYIGYSIMWYSYVESVATKSVELGKRCLRKLKRKMNADGERIKGDCSRIGHPKSSHDEKE